jgi:iron-sulfur cluster assembly accessory protein
MVKYQYNKVNTNAPLFITERAIVKIYKILETQNNTLFRIRVDGGGCNGMQYKFYTEQHSIPTRQNDEGGDDSADAEYIIILDNHYNPSVAVDKTSLEFIKGATLDYQSSLIGESFKIINNPLASSRCGCGKSFSADITKYPKARKRQKSTK